MRIVDANVELAADGDLVAVEGLYRSYHRRRTYCAARCQSAKFKASQVSPNESFVQGSRRFLES
jgi:hypothetical protein